MAIRGDGQLRTRSPHHAILSLALLLQTQDISRLLSEAVAVVASVIRTEVVAVFEVLPDRRSLRLAAAVGPDAEGSMVPANDHPDAIAAEALRSSQTLVVRDLRHNRLLPKPNADADRTMLSSVTAVIYGPGEPFGVLTGRARAPHRFPRSHVQLVQDVAQLLSVALGHRENDRALGESESRFRLMAERARDVLFRTRLVPDVKLEYISPSIEAIIGHSVTELIESADRSPLWEIIHPEDRRKVQAYLTDPIRNAYPLLTRYVHKDGSLVWTENRMTPIVDEKGIVIAIEGVIRDVTDRVLGDEQRRAYSDVLQTVLEGRQPEETLRLIVRHARRLTSADHALIMLAGDNEEGWTVRAAAGPAGPQLAGMRVPREDPLVVRIMGSPRPEIVDDLLAAFPDGHPFTRFGWSGPTILAPLRTARRSLGALAVTVAAPGRHFRPAEVAVLAQFAGQAALAVQYGHARQELQRLAVLEERARIARELHDGVIQSLFGASMALQSTLEAEAFSAAAIAGFKRVSQMIDNAVLDLRNYILELRPSTLFGRSLGQAIQLLGREFEETSGIPCSIHADSDALAAAEVMASQLIQIIREALSNIIRHATASSCRIELRRDGGLIVLEVVDDGRGFLPSHPSRGRGLKNIRLRSSQMGGTAEFLSQPGQGSTVRVRIPLKTGGGRARRGGALAPPSAARRPASTSAELG